MDLNIKDKVAVVTGSGWGIGKAITGMLAEEGAKVVVAELDEERGNSTVKELKDKGCEAFFTKVDVSKWSEVENSVAATLEKYKQIDILVNNAAAWRTDFFVKQPKEDWNVQLDVCFYGTLNFTKAVIDHMVSRKTGNIVNIASDAARVGEPNQPVYSGAKAGVVGFSKGLAKELGRYGIRVNVVCPSMTIGERRKEMTEQMKKEDPEQYAAYQETMKKILRFYPLRKFGKPEDLANIVAFLASDQRAGHITGQTISVNGGYCML